MCFNGVSRHQEADFIGSMCLDSPVKRDAQVFDMACKTIHTSVVIREYCFSALIFHENMYLKIIKL